MEYYTLYFLGLTRQLPVLKAPSGLAIAGFNCVGDMELLTRAGEDLARQLAENNMQCDVILTTEFKGIAIAQELARRLGIDYVVLRKDKKCYMDNPRQIEGGSITSGKSTYYISESDEEKLRDKNILIADDVFSTGATINTLLDYAERAKLKIVASATILKEDSMANRDKIKTGFIYRGIPNFFSGFLPLPE